MYNVLKNITAPSPFSCFPFTTAADDFTGITSKGGGTGGARGAIAPPKNCTVGLSSAHYVLPLAVCKSFSPPPPSHTASSAPDNKYKCSACQLSTCQLSTSVVRVPIQINSISEQTEQFLGGCEAKIFLI